MLKTIKTGFLAFLAVAFLASCGADGDVRANAEAAVSANTPNPSAQVTPTANPAQATTPSKAAEPAVPAGPTTTMEFDATEFNFGTVSQGEMVSHTYKFKNTGNEPLILSNAKGSCGCTVPQWPREPIAPGKSGEITVEFNSKGKKGQRNQKVTITSNTDPAQSFIYLKGEVLVPEGAGDVKVSQ